MPAAGVNPGKNDSKKCKQKGMMGDEEEGEGKWIAYRSRDKEGWDEIYSKYIQVMFHMTIWTLGLKNAASQTLKNQQILYSALSLSLSLLLLLSLSLSFSQPSLPGAFWVGIALSGGCLGLGLTDIRESKSTNEAPSPRNDAGFLVSSAVFVAMSPINRKKKLLGKNLLELVLLKQGKST